MCKQQIYITCCICLCKDTNFKANHNQSAIYFYRNFVVYAYAKILILKQITTIWKNQWCSFSCICLCKDTNFKANHNSIATNFGKSLCCICLCKDTNFKANHNWSLNWPERVVVVYAYAKILILKQITTLREYYNYLMELYMPMQRY